MTMTQERKQIERQVRRRRIQSAARGVFAQKGYAKTSIEQIAREANLSVGAIYLYFRSKEDLYISLLEETLDSVNGQLRELRGNSEGAGHLRAAWSLLVDWATNDVESTRVLRLVCQPGVRKQLSDEVAGGAAERLTALRDELAGIIQDGIGSGLYRNGEAVPSADLLWALFLGLLQQADARVNLSLPGPALSDAARAAFDRMEAMLTGGAAARQAA
jgi:AcrR family transcriptional regulator